MQTFLSHLNSALTRPLNQEVFQAGYQDVIRGVEAPGVFRLYGMTIESPSGVYSPHETSSTRFCIDHFFGMGLDKPYGVGRFLEVGCGAGAISLQAARLGWQVSAGDIDPVAVEATLRNAGRHGLQVAAKVSDLAGAFQGELFDAVLFNQPFFHMERAPEANETTLSADGASLYARFMAQVRDVLAPGGSVFFTYANFSDLNALNQPGWELDLRAFDYDAGGDQIRCLFRGRPSA